MRRGYVRTRIASGVKAGGDQDLSRRTSLKRGNGAARSFGYDAALRLSSISEDLAGTAGDLALAFTYNPAAQIASSTRSNDAYAWTAHYNFSRNYTANGLNQYSASGSVSPTYDGRGNLTSAGATTYGYSSENMLTSASGGVALAYDPFLRLQQTSGGSAGTTKFGYDGQDLIAEYDGSNGLLRRYVHGPGSDEPLVWYEGTGTADRRWLHADERGSVIAVSNSAGATIATNAYDEYGIPKSTNTGRFQYTGQTWLPELGMYHYKARIYSPTLGRFLQADPIGYGDGMNMYAYVGGDPVNRVDPLGLKKKCAKGNKGDIEVCGQPDSDSGVRVSGGAALLSASRGRGPSPGVELLDSEEEYLVPVAGKEPEREADRKRRELEERIRREAERRRRNAHCAALRVAAATEAVISGTAVGAGAAVVALKKFGERFGPAGFLLGIAGGGLYAFSTATEGHPECQ
jgi:RHS repeat-associated protein